MRKKAKHRRNKWRRYEAEKKALATRGLNPAAYEKALQELTQKAKTAGRHPAPALMAGAALQRSKPDNTGQEVYIDTQ